jgi:uncharacterized protein (DUF433 family)
MDFLGRGVYSVADAARLTRVRPQKAREWFRGRKSPSRATRPVFESDYPVLHEEYALSFLDLVELNVAGKLREASVSLQSLRKVYNALRDDFGDHPFCTRQIYVGGKQVFTRGLDDVEGSSVIEAITRQSYFDKIILPFLKKIDYDAATKKAIRWHIANLVVVDPTIQLGKPVVEKTGITTYVLNQSYYANGEDAEFVARWFGVQARHVRAAVDFENQLAA